MLGKKLGLDLGSSTTRVMTGLAGAQIAEPSVVAGRDSDVATTAFGLAALRAVAEDATLQLRRPIVNGDVDDPRALVSLVHHAVNRAVGRQRIFKPDLVVAVRGGMGGDDRRAVLDAAARAGARTVYLIDAAIASALGAGISITSAQPHMVIDVGAGKTDVAVLVLEGTVASRSLTRGADDLLEALSAHVQAVHGTLLDRDQLGDAVHLLVAAGHEERTAEIGGVLLSSHDLAPLVAEHLAALDEAIAEVLDETPAALVRDVRAAGVLLAGGGARLEGLVRHVAMVAGCSARLAHQPEGCAVRGAALAVDNLDVLKRNFMYIR